MTALHAHGVNGTVSFDGTVVTITRQGAIARLLQGRSVKHLPVRQIQAVQAKPAGIVVNGFIQFTVPGEMSSRVVPGARTYDAARDENAVMFTRAQQDPFLELAAAITAAIANGPSAPTVDLSALPAPAPAADPGMSLDRQLGHLADLHRTGALTDAEFDRAKARLLG